VVVWLFGGDPQALLQNLGSGGAETVPASSGPAATGNAAQDELAKSVSVVLADMEADGIIRIWKPAL
jgi:hypothetical protein